VRGKSFSYGITVERNKKGRNLTFRSAEKELFFTVDIKIKFDGINFGGSVKKNQNWRKEILWIFSETVKSAKISSLKEETDSKFRVNMYYV